MNVLIIEDSAIEREYISKILMAESFNPILAENGEKGLSLAEEEVIDIILLDIIMPVIDGYEVCEQLKQNPKTKDIPVIFITGNNDIGSLQKAFEVGGVDFIGKPVNKYNVLARVKVHFEQNKIA